MQVRLSQINFELNSKGKKNLNSEQHSAHCICKPCLFSDAFRVSGYSGDGKRSSGK